MESVRRSTHVQLPQEIRIYYRGIGLVDEPPQGMADAVAEKIPEHAA